MKGKKLAYFLLTSVGTGLFSQAGYTTISAIAPYNFFHIYSRDEVNEIQSEFNQMLGKTADVINSLPDSVTREELLDSLHSIEEKSKSQFLLDRGFYKNFYDLIIQLNGLYKRTSTQLKNIQKVGDEELRKIRDSQIKVFNQKKKELRAEFLSLSNDLKLIYSKLENESELMIFAQNLDKNIKNAIKKLESLNCPEKYSNENHEYFEEYLSCIFEDVEEELNDLKNGINLLGAKEKSQEIKISCTKVFDQKKKELAREYLSIQKNLNLISPKLESEPELVSTIQDLNKKVENGLKKLESMSFSDEYIASSDSDLEECLNTVFESVKEDLSNLTNTMNTLQSYAEKISAELEKVYIDSARDDLLTELEDLDQYIRTEFSCSELEDKSIIEYIDSIRSDLCDSLNDLKSRVLYMTNRDEKANIERDFGFFKKKCVRLQERKTRKVKLYLERKQQERNIENSHDFSAQLEMLRQGTTTIDNVVGGYRPVINRMNELIENIAQCSETGKGVPSKGMVLYGKPGVGKTSLVQAVAAAKNLNCVILKKGTSLGDMSAEIVKKFSEAETLTDNGTKTVVLLIDEIDAIGATRIPGKTDKETVALLGALDKLKSNSNIAVIATTNIISSIDEAVTRSGRLEELVEVAGPDESEVFDIIKIAIAGYRIEEGVSADSFASRFVSSFRGCTGADIKRAVEKAIQRKMKRTGCTRLSDVTLSVSDLEPVVKNF